MEVLLQWQNFHVSSLKGRTKVENFPQLSCLLTKPTMWLCTQRRLRSAWAFAQSSQSLCCALIGQLKVQPFFMRTAKTLIRLDGCQGSSGRCWFCHEAAHLLFALISPLKQQMSQKKMTTVTLQYHFLLYLYRDTLYIHVYIYICYWSERIWPQQTLLQLTVLCSRKE